MTPRISVVMCVYNGARYLPEAMESLLRQTFGDFELIVVDDGSTDETPALLEAYARADGRVVLDRNPRNLGVPASLKRGVSLARGEFVARHDADDIACPERLETQLAYMEAHPDIAMVSSGVLYVDPEGRPLHRFQPPTNPALLRWRLLFNNPIRHPTALWRRAVVAEQAGTYDAERTGCEDFEFWARVVERLRIAVMPGILTRMRKHPGSVTAELSGVVCTCADGVCRRQVSALLDEPVSEQEAADLRRIERGTLAGIPAERLKASVSRLCRIWERFQLRHADLLAEAGAETVQKQVEHDLDRVFRYCRRRRWIGLGYQAAREYLQARPARTSALLGPLVRMTLLPALGGAVDAAGTVEE